ncbi:MAG: hypothetical protein RTV31_03070 [Candidatus Thorarchaeota archaeon]
MSKVEDELRNIHDESFECDWCGVTSTKAAVTTRRKTRFYCSLECSRAEDFVVFAILSAFGFLASITTVLVPIPDGFSVGLLAAIMGFITFFCALDTWKIRRRTPRGSKKEQYFDNDIS